ncbi:hypothetical protein [Novosphingobium sp.]|uniref:hypothetical protein n=1 Tax=Novosphingobium sp. TaxID=1874826 RepID=UPI003B526634
MNRFLGMALAPLLVATPNQSFAQNQHHDWTTQIGDDKRSVFAANTNADGSVLMENCNVDTKKCTWLMGGDTSCDNDKSAPALLNSDKYAGSIDLICRGEVNKGLYAYAFSDWKALESLIKESKNLAIAVAIGNNNFKVFRFSLFGMTESQKEAEDIWQYMINKDQNSNPTGARVGNTVL